MATEATLLYFNIGSDFHSRKIFKLQMQKQLMHLILAPYELKQAESACITSLTILLEIV